MSLVLASNFTKIPDVFLDEWLPCLSPADFKVVMFIARKTFGWRKDSVAVSNSYMARGTGLSYRQVIESCKVLEVAGMLIITRSDLPKGHPESANTYRLNVEAKISLYIEATGRKSKNQPGQKDNQCRECTSTSVENAVVPVQRMHTIRDKETNKETNITFPSGEKGVSLTSFSNSPKSVMPPPSILTAGRSGTVMRARNLPDFADRFERDLWQPHPCKKEKVSALAAAGNLTVEQFNEACQMTAPWFVVWQAKVDAGKGQYVPYLSTFLSQRRWMEAPTQEEMGKKPQKPAQALAEKRRMREDMPRPNTDVVPPPDPIKQRQFAERLRALFDDDLEPQEPENKTQSRLPFQRLQEEEKLRKQSMRLEGFATKKRVDASEWDRILEEDVFGLDSETNPSLSEQSIHV